MKLAIATWCNKETGMGHFYRCLALCEEAFHRGHQITFFSDYYLPNGIAAHFFQRYDDPKLNKQALEYKQTEFDWLILDTPGKSPDWVNDIVAKKCVIDGIGHNSDFKADIVISQGFEGSEYRAPDYIIIRRSPIFHLVFPEPVENGMFVFGGGVDKLNITERFINCCHDVPANIVRTLMMDFIPPPNNKDHRLYHLEGSRIFTIIRASSSATVHMGMIVPELIFFNIPPHIFSYSERHLRDAKVWETNGYGLAYDKVGLPDKDEEFREFILRPAKITGKPIDGKGAERVISLLETYG